MSAKGESAAGHQLAAASMANAGRWLQAGELGLALLLSAVIGWNGSCGRSAGLRTHTRVGVRPALFMLISKYGFSDVLQPGRIVVDPSRVAAQIATGIGFPGAGIILVRRDSGRGLTTVAGVWVTAVVGAAAEAGLPRLAAPSTGVAIAGRSARRELVESNRPAVYQAETRPPESLTNGGVLLTTRN